MDIMTVSGLTKKFAKFTAVDNISFSLGEGEILGLLGPNGAGKTTTIQMLLGVLTPTDGEISYFGKNMKKNREEIMEDVNFSSTYTNLPWLLTVKENLTFLSYLYDIPDRKKQLEKVISIFRLEKLLKSRINDLSAGQLTRVNLAKAFINSPKVLLLDEPTASLDPEIAAYIRQFILERREKENLSLIFTSHNMLEVEEVCDRVLFINKGKIIADDTPVHLAESIDTSHITLYIDPAHDKELTQYCAKNNLLMKRDKRYVTIDVKESHIAKFLNEIVQNGIEFKEIFIEKPSLEDYFIQVARGENKKTQTFDKVI